MHCSLFFWWGTKKAKKKIFGVFCSIWQRKQSLTQHLFRPTIHDSTAGMLYKQWLSVNWYWFFCRSNCTGVHLPLYECSWGCSVDVDVSYLQVGLLAALDELVESRCSEVGMDVGRVQPLQSLHDDLLQDEWTEDTFCSSNTELVHIVDSWQHG